VERVQNTLFCKDTHSGNAVNYLFAHIKQSAYLSVYEDA
jgi:hypothetical protein